MKKPIIELHHLIAVVFTIILAVLHLTKNMGIIPMLCSEGVVVIFFVVCPTLFRSNEKKQYNNGICPKCGHALRRFGTCFCGDEGYTCDHCGYSFWSSWFRPTKEGIYVDSIKENEK